MKIANSVKYNSLSFVIFLYFIVNIANCSVGTITETLLKKRGFSEYISFNYLGNKNQTSRITCVGFCLQHYDWDQIYYIDKACYCLAPVFKAQLDPSILGQVAVSPNSFISIIYRDIASCLVNNYITFVGYCLKFIPTPLAWNDAETYCQQDGGHLVSPDTPEKFSKLSNLYKNDINIWIGGHLSELNGEYRWTSGEHFDPSLWNTGEPNMCYGIERCSLVLKTGKLNDKDCDAKYPFICELTIN